MNLVFNGPDTAEAMRTAIVALIEHNLARTKEQSARVTSAKQSVRYAGELAALTTTRDLIKAMVISNNS